MTLSVTANSPVFASSISNHKVAIDTSSQAAGLDFRLSAGGEASYTFKGLPASKADYLPQAAIDGLLQRVPPITVAPEDSKEFSLREKTIQLPMIGSTVASPFPPPLNAPAIVSPASAPLELIRYAPEGFVAIAPNLSVTFSQPMVPVSSQEETAGFVPVKLSPQPPGKWRWIDTKTLLFEPEGRFPMSTDYIVTIPAGTTSAAGGVLTTEKQWRFATESLTVVSSYPTGGPTLRDPLIFLEFNQRIDRQAILPYLHISVSGDMKLPLRLATDEEIAADSKVSKLATAAVKGRWLAVRILPKDGLPDAEPLPSATWLHILIANGAPSAEGPRKASYNVGSFHTYYPLQFSGSRCGYQKCRPTDSWGLNFNNPLDSGSLTEKSITVEPKLPGMTVSVYGSSISISGEPRARTSYRIIIDKSLKDIFGQSLSEDKVTTISVGDAEPALIGPESQFVVLDPNGLRQLPVYSINHPELTLRLYTVNMDHMTAFEEYKNYWRDKKPPASPGRLVVEKKIDLSSYLDEMKEVLIDLEPALVEGLGNVVVEVEPTVQPDPDRPQRVRVWAQSTQIGLSAFVGSDNIVAWATALADGSPLPGVELSIREIKPKVKSEAGYKLFSGEDGLARLPLPTGSGSSPRMLVARKGNDVAFLPEGTYWRGSQSYWLNHGKYGGSRTYAFTDRGVYRPGEEVHLKGWQRYWQNDRLTLPQANREFSYELSDSRGNKLITGKARLNSQGGFDIACKLPEKMNLGNATIRSEEIGLYKTFQVEEFRRPEFEVKVAAERTVYFAGEQPNLTANAAYYAGGALPENDITWRVTASPADFTPPNRSSFSFGRWRPWWRYYPERETVRSEVYYGKTDPSGNHRLLVDLGRIDPPFATVLTAEASVADLNRQSWRGTTKLLIHPADLYVGLRAGRTFVNNGAPLSIEAIVTDLEGQAIAGRNVKITATRLEWVHERDAWKQKETDVETCSQVSTEAPFSCSFKPKRAGTYRVAATVADDRNRENRSELTVWVAGDRGGSSVGRDLEKVELIPDRSSYREGDTAQILVQAPFYPAKAILTLRRNGIVQTEHFTMTGSTHTLSIQLRKDYIPNLHVQVDLVGAAARGDSADDSRPVFAMGEVNLSIPPLSYKLAVTATPREREIPPKGETVVDLELRDGAGNPVTDGEVVLVVVDEAVLALTSYQLPDPLAAFYPERNTGVTDFHLRSYLYRRANNVVKMRKGEALAAKRMNAEYGGVHKPDISLRSDFNPLAVFIASVQTDANGKAAVPVRLPDNLTRYRVMAVATADSNLFGAGESTITARLPLMVRPSPPRFLNFGDKFELPIVVQNQTNKPIKVDLALRATNARLLDGSGRRLQVPPNDRVEVRIPATTITPGIARFQIVAAAGSFSDAAEVSLPVRTPATTEAFATYGEIDDGSIAQPIKTPDNVFSQFGGLEVITSSTQLQGLTDAVLYLASYPYDCAEQVSSRLLAFAGLRDILTAFAGKGLPGEKELAVSVERDIKRLQALQNFDGGFGLWRRQNESLPFVSIHAAHALQRAVEKGFSVPSEMIERSKQYLRNIENYYQGWYQKSAKEFLTSYALYVRSRMGDRDVNRAKRLLEEADVDRFAPEALGWLLAVFTDQDGTEGQKGLIKRNLANRVTETAGMAHFTTSFTDQEYLLFHSNRRADGVILEALIGDQPQSDLIPKIVRDLLAHRVNGRWANTQDNVFVLLALDRYFHAYENVTPDFVSRIWLGDRFAGEQRFSGYTVDRHRVEVPMSYLASGDKEQQLTLSKDGKGRLYYRIGLNYAPVSLFLTAFDAGFTVNRIYEGVDNPADVSRSPDGSWHIKAGARVRVKLTMIVPTRRYHVALVDPLPAGLEPLNPALAITEAVQQRKQEAFPQTRGSWWRQNWFEHQNLRDERVEAFASILGEGVYSYSYVARATTPGEFVVPPAKAEEMYSPEVFGRTGSDRVIIKAAGTIF